jgi:serine/threonine-protein kinase RsbW
MLCFMVAQQLLAADRDTDSETVVLGPADSQVSRSAHSLLRIREQTKNSVDVEVGGMDEGEFAVLPFDQKSLIEAIQAERLIVALTLAPETKSHPDVCRADMRMREFAEEDNPKCAASAYIASLMDMQSRLAALLERKPHVLEIGNNPGKLDRLSVPMMQGVYAQVLDMISHILPPDPTLLKFKVAVEEAFRNHTAHGMGQDPRKHFRLRMINRGSDVGIVMSDDGWGYRPDLVVDPTAPENLQTMSGRGIYLMRQFSDRAYIARDGRRSGMRKALS